MSINNSNRIEIIDYLKGVALCGVLLMHVTHFGGFRILPFEILNDLPFSRFDKTIFAYLELLIKGKFFAIFSVMFGWSLAKSIEKFGHNNKSILYRRALLLLAIGLIHTFIFYLDILVAYAICSLLIITIGLKVVNKPFKVYLIAFASFIMLSFIIDFYELKFILANGVKAKTARLEYPNLPSQKIWDWFQSGDIVNILRLNMIQLKYYLISNMYSLQFIYIFLNILLGIFLYKIKFHMNVFNKKIFFFAIILTVVHLYLLPDVNYNLYKDQVTYSHSWYRIIRYLFDLGLAYIYTSLFLIMSKNKFIKNSLIKMGRMSLSVYVLQTVYLFIVFYGFKNIGRLSLLEMVIFALVSNLGFIVFSHFYIKYNKLGPLEKIAQWNGR